MKGRNKPQREKKKSWACPVCKGAMAKGKKRCKTCKRKRRAAVISLLLGGNVVGT